MVDVYRYITSKHWDGYKIVNGFSMGFHGMNYDDSAYNKKAYPVRYMDDDIVWGDRADNKDK